MSSMIEEPEAVNRRGQRVGKAEIPRTRVLDGISRTGRPVASKSKDLLHGHDPFLRTLLSFTALG